MSRPFTIEAKDGFKGYTADASVAPPDRISEPSTNCLVNENGEIEQRLGYLVEEDIDLGEEGKAARSFYMEQWDITVFTLGTKVKYFDWNTRQVYDTGLTLTDETICRGDQYAGDLYITNTADGLRRLVFFRLRGAASETDTTLDVDYDGAARLSVFSISSGTVRIQGIAETFSGTDVGNGNLTVDALSQDYDDNAVAVVTSDISSGLEFASKAFFWKERMGLIGSELAGNADQPNATTFFGKFAGPDTLEDIIAFGFSAGGSTREIIGRFGKLTNAVPTKDFLYLFKENQGYVAAAGDVITSGSGIGGTPSDLRDENHGCINEDCAATPGFSQMTYVTSDKRILLYRLSTKEGAASPFADESFDIPVRKHLQNMDEDQTGALVYYYKGGRKTIYQLHIGGQWLWLIYDHLIDDWQPPQQITPVSSFFERKGVLYGTDSSDDTVYSFFTSFSDGGNAIDSIVSWGDFSVRDSMMTQCHVMGVITQPAKLMLRSHVTNQRGGEQTGSQKTIDGSMFSYAEDKSVGALPVGGSPGGPQESVMVADFKKTFDIYPSEGYRVKIRATQGVDGGYYRISRMQIDGVSFSSSFTPSI